MQMNIDPRVMSQLLKLQMLNSSTLISGGTPDPEQSSSDFSAILQSFLGQASAKPESVSADPLTSSFLPANLLGMNQSYSPLQSLSSKQSIWCGF
jgi:hypothetical protein